MFDLGLSLAFESAFANNALGLGSLLVIVLVLAVVQDWIAGIWNTPKASPKESAEPEGSVLISPARKYVLQEKIGHGDLCDVYWAASGRDEYMLKIARMPGGGKLLAKEFSILEILESKSRGQVYSEFFPKPVETFSAAGWPVNALEFRDGFYTAEQIRDRYHRGLDGRHLGWMFNRILEALGFVHQQGYLHGAVLPPHLLFHAEDHGLLLAGWIHAEKANTSLKVVPDRYQEWYPPECRKKHPATPSVDIYLAAKCLIYLAGGDPVANTFPDHVPVPMQRFLRGCLLESPRMRSQDAWSLRQEFGQVLERLYGPPAFHILEMS